MGDQCIYDAVVEEKIWIEDSYELRASSRENFVCKCR